MNGNEETAAELIAVGRNCVDLITRVRTLEHSAGGPTTRIAANHQHVAIECRRFTLHSQQTLANIEDEVVALVGNRSKYSDS
jgi:hypothetical protein